MTSAAALPSPATPASFVVSRRSDGDGYQLWHFDPAAESLLTPLPLSPQARLDRRHQLIQIGGYLLEWGPLELRDYYPSFPYRLFAFDPASPDPLGAEPVQKGLWPKTKFWQSRVDFGNPDGGHEQYDSGDELLLIPLHNFLLNFIPTDGRGTFQLWNFDPSPLAPGSADPLPAPYTPQGAFDAIEYGHQLIPVGNYVLDVVAASGSYTVWSFDPQNPIPVARPTVAEGRWPELDAGHSLAAIGEFILDWTPADGSYRLWHFDPSRADPLGEPLRSGRLPAGFDAHTTLTGLLGRTPIDPALSAQPGTLDFMRSRIKHVVYLMLENRSFDHVCGWLYEHGQESIRFVGKDGPFQGASTEFYNLDGKDKVHLSKYKDGKLSEDWLLELLDQDPYHDYSDVMRQLFFTDRDGYRKRAVPDMGGFIWNNGTRQVMETYSPEQLPVLNGLAREYGVSDQWFCSMPGGTDVNRAFSLTGSALQQLNNFQNGATYEYWPETPHRPSIWKTLWSNGITDWKIYNSVEWFDYVFSYHLFLQGEIPYVDANLGQFVAGIDQFKEDARRGKLPGFSFLEPVWIAESGTTSYHPGGDLVPGERALNEIYDALRAGPGWEDTLLVITFDEHGGIYDHVAPPYAVNPWPNDVNDGFRYDMLGLRVPTILVSPWIEQNTVFRAAGDTAYDSTSILATLLQWYGIPKTHWGLGDRCAVAPTFEAALRAPSPRRETPAFVPPYDKDFPPRGPDRAQGLHPLHEMVLPRLLGALLRDRLTPDELMRESKAILASAKDLPSLHRLINATVQRLR